MLPAALPGIVRSLPAAMPGIAHLSAFMLIFKFAVGMLDINYGRFPLFEPLFPASGTSAALKRRFRGLQRNVKGRSGFDSCS